MKEFCLLIGLFNTFNALLLRMSFELCGYIPRFNFQYLCQSYRPIFFLEREVHFHHFPDFDARDGQAGSTLHWNPKSNELKVSDHDEEFKALCYRPKRDKGNILTHLERFIEGKLHPFWTLICFSHFFET